MAERKPARKQPQALRMRTPGYGFEGAKSAPGKKFPWTKVERLLKTARNYWIGTAGPQGRPHSAPVWGVWLDGVFYFSTGDESRKGRNLAKNPRVTVHPELIDDAIILEGSVEKMKASPKLKSVWQKYKTKYKWGVDGSDFYALRPARVYSYTEPDFIESATRWQFSRRRKRG